MLRRLRLWDAILLVGLTGLWAVAFSLTLYRALGDGVWDPALAVEGATPGTYPVLAAVPAPNYIPDSALALGDRIVSIAGHDLAGASALDFALELRSRIDGAGRVSLVFERDGERREIAYQAASAVRWELNVVSLGMAVVAVLGLLGAGGTALGRYFFAACIGFGLHVAWFTSGPRELVLFGFFTYTLGGFLCNPCGILTLLQFPPEVARTGRAARWLPWLAGPAAFGFIGMFSGAFLQPSVAFPLGLAGGAAAMLALIAVFVANYRRASAVGRRKMRWIGIAVYVCASTAIAANLAYLSDPALRWLVQTTNALTILFPICFLVALIADDALDVDRLITATATYSIILVALVVAGIALAPPVVSFLSASGAPAVPAQLGLALAAGVAIAPLHRRLRPRVEQLFFPERATLRDELFALEHELAAERDADELAQRLVERLAGGVKPERCAVYAPAAGALRGVAASGIPGREALEGAPVPAWALDAGEGIDMIALGDDGDRELLLALRRGPELAFLLHLGRRRSGDIYTRDDQAALAHLAERAGVALLRIQSDELRLRSSAERAANEAKSRFLAVASHDLRQPLHALSLFVGTLAQRPDSPDARALVGRIERSAEALEELLNSVLEVSKLEAGVLEPRLEDIALAPLFAALHEELEPQAAERGLSLRVAATGAVVRSDRVLLARALRNLVINALRYTERGGVLVGARPRGARVELQVWDTGRGFATEARARLFAEFERGDTREEGHGLGLSIVERIAKTLDHPLRLRSEPGRGSVLSLSVPRGALALRLEPAAQETAELEIRDPLRGRRILVIDDDPAIRDAMKSLLVSWGALATPCAAAPREAELRALDPELVVCDYTLVEATGLDVLAVIRAALGRAVPALVITGETDPTARRRLEASGEAWLIKPVAVHRLRARLMQLLPPSV